MVRRNLFLKGVSLFCTSAILVTMLAGCGDKKTTGQGASASTSAPTSAVTKKAPVKVSIMLPLYNTEAPPEGSPIELKMEEFTNSQLELNFVPSNSYNDKVNVSIASGQLPDVFAALDLKAPTVVNSARSGMFWDLTTYVKSTLPTLSKNLDATTLKNSSIDGKNYALPRGRAIARFGAVVYRKDWAQKLGLKAPQTMDDLYNMMKAFSTQDPDGNGKADTYGLAAGLDANMNFPSGSFDGIAILMGAGNGWELKDGKASPVFTSAPYMDAMKWYKKIFDEKLMNQDFGTVKPEQIFDMMDQQKTGIYIAAFDDINRHDNLMKLLQAADTKLAGKAIGDMKLDYLDAAFLKAKDGTVKIQATAGFNGGFVFPKSTLKTEDRLKEVLNVFDKLDTPEGQSIIAWGVEGKHYIMEGGFAKEVADAALIAKERGTLWQLFITNQQVNRASVLGKNMPAVEYYKKVETENAKNVVVDISVPLISDTNSTLGSELNKIINDARVKFIFGSINEDGWNQAIEKWKKTGGDKVIQEFTDAIVKSK